ncbi:MAG: hypothetical protein O6763_09520 [Gammaproteobacteria bacterium]|nr:hypothetical protein [Gammaproteobacteria bacterium]
MAATPALEKNLKRVALMLVLLPLAAAAELHVVIVEGLGGTAEYATRFSEEVAKLELAAGTVTAAERVRVFTVVDATQANILAYFATLSAAVSAEDRVVVYLIGHGSYDGYDYKFNLPGPDLTGEQLAELLEALPANNQLLVNTSSASGATLERLTDDARVVITATRSGSERNAARFGSSFVAALEDPAADINKNNAISAQEAFDYAVRQVTDYFEYRGQLATEHPQLKGKRAARFTLARLRIPEPAGDDPELGLLFEQRDRIDGRIEELRLRKHELATDEYYAQLQTLLLELARVGDRIDLLDEAEESAPGDAQ